MKESGHHSIVNGTRRGGLGFQCAFIGKLFAGRLAAAWTAKKSGAAVERSGMYRHIIVENGAVAGTNGIDSLHLECVTFEIVHSATKDVVRFAFEFRRGMRGALFGGKGIGIETVGSRLIFRVFLDQLNIGRGERCGLRPIVKPAARREQDEDNDEDDHHVVRPAAALVRPENCVYEAAPELTHASERLRRPQRARRACGGRDGRKRRPRDCG